ncbi:MAG: aminomethyltransferase family protein, partial [Actinomycetota bacterium]
SGRLDQPDGGADRSHLLGHHVEGVGSAERDVLDRLLPRSNAFDVVAEEVAAVRSAVGLIETTGFASYEITGPGARAWLDGLLTNHLPPPGRLVLTPMLNQNGTLIGDFTVACIQDHADIAERFMIFGSGPAEEYHLRWFHDHLPADGSVAIRSFGPDLCGLAIAGPRAQDLLAAISDGNPADQAADPRSLSFLDFRTLDIGMHRCLVGRISYTGDLGYELWMPATDQAQVFDRILAAGEEFGLRLFGARALDSMRLEKGFGAWATEFRPIYTPDQAGLGWAVRTTKSFVGRDAVVAEREAGIGRRLAFFTLDEDAEDVAAKGPADAIGDEPIRHGDRVVGWITSGGYAHHSGASMAVGYVETSVPDEELRFTVEVFGVQRRATRLTEPLFDPKGDRMRA